MKGIKTLQYFTKRGLRVISLWSKKTFNPNEYSKPDLDSSQKKAISICTRMINHHNSELLVSLVSEKRYIKNSDYFLVIEFDSIRIVNHVYSYDIKIHGKRMTNLKNSFDKKLDSIRINMEDEIMQNVTHSLDDISKKMKMESWG